MQNAIVIVPKAPLYETVSAVDGQIIGQHVSDELLSGWLITIRSRQGNFREILTTYGYSGWISSSDIRELSQEEYGLWNICSKSVVLLTQRLTDILSAPRVQSPVLSTLFMGSTVIPWGDSENGWQKIKLADDTLGYVPAIALSAPKGQMEHPTQLRSAILNYALSYLGTQYRWGGKTHEGIDCSGLTFMSYYMCGILIYRDAVIREGYPVREIPRDRIKPADLLYFPGHVALYLGNCKYLHSTGNLKNFGCVINSLNPRDQDYRSDLAENLTAVGSIFPDPCF